MRKSTSPSHTLTLSAHDQVEDAAQQERLTQFLDMAFWHTEAGNTDAAVRACQAALAIHPDSTTAHSLLGSLYEKKGDDAQAIQHFEQVLALNPDSEADRAKLEQLREGIHTQPVKPSGLYRWLPPALAHSPVAGLVEKVAEGPGPTSPCCQPGRRPPSPPAPWRCSSWRASCSWSSPPRRPAQRSAAGRCHVALRDWPLRLRHRARRRNLAEGRAPIRCRPPSCWRRPTPGTAAPVVQ